jgi:hypothetical protein
VFLYMFLPPFLCASVSISAVLLRHRIDLIERID